MSNAHFQIVYDGPALDLHEMDVNDLAPALLAIGGLMEAVGNVLQGDKFKITVSVKGSFKTGCFGVDMVAHAKNIIVDAMDVFNHGSTSAVLNAAGIIGLVNWGGGTLIGFLRWAKNRKVSKTEIMDDGIVRVFIDNEHYDIEQQALEMLKNFKIRKAFEALIHAPLTREGIDSFSILSAENPTQPILHIDSSEALYFIAPAPADEEINDHTTIVSLQVVNASFAEGNKWRFSDGSNTFFADILDEGFISRVQSSEEVFAKNDILKVKLRISQWLTSRGMRTDYIIQEVIEHRLAHRQIDLFEHQGDEP
ncbi:MAG: hypothetical protein Q8Q50_02710 [Methylobacter sp.]|nr:hypothetical protein [Methylobacter sp.]